MRKMRERNDRIVDSRWFGDEQGGGPSQWQWRARVTGRARVAWE